MMRILFEGAKYNIDDLEKCFGDKFYHQIGSHGYIDVVGYYHSNDNQLYYFLPKLFITDNDTFLDTNFQYQSLFNESVESFLKRDITLLNWFRKFLIIFYKSLAEYKNRVDGNIIQLGDTLQLSSNIGKNEFTFLDLVLSLLNFYKKNRDFFIFHTKEQQSLKHKKVNWNKTIRKQQPVFVGNTPIYDKLNTKVKKVNNDEILMTYFYSVLNHLKDEYKVDIQIDCPYNLIKGKRFEIFLETGIYKIKKIKNNYYSDKLKAIYNLLVLFFEKSFIGSVKNKSDDFIIVKKYHNVFEDMVDKLLSDSFSERKTSNGISLNFLKNNQDGKILDHLFEFDSILDTDESIFYIGDSKYYKHNSYVRDNSIYKQFTYAKNVIQYNIDLLQEDAKIPSLINKNIRYRDDITEGYSISPNFFIQGIIKDINDYDTNSLVQNIEKGTEKNAHFKERLFDRDTLFINYYEINFLFVLNSYTNYSPDKILETRQLFKNTFKTHFRAYFKNHSGFNFYGFNFNSEQELKEFVDVEFRHITGRVIRTISNPNKLILAINPSRENKLKEKSLLNRFVVTNNPITKQKEFVYNTNSSIKPAITDYEI
ncbi:hypothetical protein [Chryseobacterium sp. A321]